MWKLIALSGLLVFGLEAADLETCPAKIGVQPQQLATPFPGWTAARTAEPHHDLWFVTFYDGDPKERASLVPDINTRLRQAWTLAPQSRTYWLECHYTQTTVVLARPLPANIKGCEVTYAASITIDGSPVIKQIHCR